MNKLQNSTFTFPFIQAHGLSKQLVDFLEIDRKNTEGIKLSLCFEIIPNEYIRISVLTNQEEKIVEKEYSLRKKDTLVALKSLSSCLTRSMSSEVLDTVFENNPQFDSELKEFLEFNAVTGSILAIACYPNLLKTKFGFNFLSVLKEEWQLEILCSDKPSALKVAQVFFPLVKKKSAQSIISLFTYQSEYDEFTYYVQLFPPSLLGMFKNEDKFSTFYNKIDNFYKDNFSERFRFSLESASWMADEGYGFDSFLEDIICFLPKNEHNVENFLINSLDILFEEIIEKYEEADMGEDLWDGQLDVFYLFEYYMGDIPINLSTIDSFVSEMPKDHPNYEKTLKFHQRFFSKLKEKDILSLHDELSAHLTDLNAILYGETTFGDKENLTNAKFYDYDSETVGFFNDHIDGFDFKLAESNQDLIFLGEKMNHCVGGYHVHLASNKEHLVLGVFEKNKPLLCIEIFGDTLIQAKKSSNRRLKRSFEKDRRIISALKKYIAERNLNIDTGDLAAIKN